jgi:tetratricopeptide (TPR) repeat protein
MIFRELNHFETALNYFSICEELTQSLTDVREILSIIYYEKAKTYFLMKDYDNVIKYIKRNIEQLGRDGTELRYIFGLAYLGNNNREAAKKEFNNAIKLNDNENYVTRSKIELQDLR